MEEQSRPSGCLSVCLPVCLSASISPKLHGRSSPIFVNVNDVRGAVEIRYVLPVLWTTLCLHRIVRNSRRSSDSVGSSVDLSLWRILKLTHQGAAPGRGRSLIYLPLFCWVLATGPSGEQVRKFRENHNVSSSTFVICNRATWLAR